jgi:small ligand-binding sensory domain FIST
VNGGGAISAVYRGGWNETRLRRWCESARARLAAPSVSLGVLTLTPPFFDVAAEVLEVVRVHARVPLLVGVSSNSLVMDGEELEGESGAALLLLHLPGACLSGVHFDNARLAALDDPADWRTTAGPGQTDASSWLAFAEPFHFDGEAWLRGWNSAYPGIPIVGGLASGDPGEARAQVYLDGEVFEEGAVAVHVGGDVVLEPVVSQGCTPIGQPWTVTRADRNFIHTIANRPAYSVLVDTFNGLSKEEQSRAQNNLFVGFASSEYVDEHRRGDFLVRNLIGADPEKGVIAVGAAPRAGQTVQFHRRDAATAGEDLVARLNAARKRLAGRRILSGFLAVCNGRGHGLFGKSGHDAGLVQEILGPLPVTGFFGNGELGPVGARTFLHGYTACLGLFTSR